MQMQTHQKMLATSVLRETEDKCSPSRLSPSVRTFPLRLPWVSYTRFASFMVDNIAIGDGAMYH